MTAIGTAVSDAAVARRALQVLCFVLLGKAVAAAKEMAIAWRYGVSEVVDGYLLAFAIANWIPSLWMTVLTLVLVPLLARSASFPPGAMRRFDAELGGAALVIGIAATAIAVGTMLAALGAGWLAPGSEVMSRARVAILGLAPTIVIGTSTVLMSVRLMARGSQANTLFEAVPAACLLLAVLAWPSMDLGPLLLGTFVGAAAQLWLSALLVSRVGWIDRPRFGVSGPVWAAFRSGFGIVCAGQALMSLISVVDPIVAAGLGPGTVSTLSYASRILALLAAIGTTVVARALLPVLSRAVANGRDPAVDRLAWRWASAVFAGGAVLAALGAAFAPPMVRLLFERGAFGPAETEAVTELLRWALPQLPFYFAGVALVQWLSSRQRYVAIAGVAALCLAVKLAANALLVPAFGARGLMAATVAMYASSAIALALAAAHRSAQER
jgi:putative peptidoglycan lipid II flippase